jgi:hypothetical protein
LCESGDSPGLSARPATFISETLVRQTFDDRPVGLLEIDHMACAFISPYVRFQRFESVVGRNFRQGSIFRKIRNIVQQFQI